MYLERFQIDLDLTWLLLSLGRGYLDILDF